MALKTNTTDMINKYKIIRPCTNIKPKFINRFNNRSIDILLFEKTKFVEKQNSLLIEIFQKYTNKNIVKLVYGSYKKKEMEILANNSKFIIYNSYYDTGAIGLKEIQNYGVFAFTHQKELVIDKDTCFYIPELSDLCKEYQIYYAFLK